MTWALISDDWLSECLLRPAFHLSWSAAEESPPRCPDEVLASVPPRSFVDTRVPTDEVGLLHELVDAGFRPVETNVTLQRGLPMDPPRTDAVRFAEKGDREVVREIARSGLVSSRFHLDPLVEKEVSRNLKARWADDFFLGARGDWMVVANAAAACAGFLQLLARDKTLLIDLIAVSEAARRKGLAADMIRYACAECDGFDRVRVGTQITNTASLRLYASLGFDVVESSYVLHFHSHRSGASS